MTGRVLLAKAAILTLPLGVLQARRVAFSPQPVEILKAADSLVMGLAARVVYEFDSSFWKLFASLKGVSFLFAPEATPPTWWTTSPQPGTTLTGWIAGRKAKRLEMDLLPETGLETLSIMLGSELHEVRKHLVRWHMHDWQIDPHSLGAYTYVPRGAIDASDQLSRRWSRRSSLPANIPTPAVTGVQYMERCAPDIARPAATCLALRGTAERNRRCLHYATLRSGSAVSV